MEHVDCDFCGSRDAVEVTRQTDILHRTTDEVFAIVRCTGCGLQFVNPRPTADEIGRYYAEEYSFHAAPSRLRRFLADALEAVANSPLYRLCGLMPYVGRRLGAHVKPCIADPVRRHLPPGTGRRILDIGCGAGMHAHFWGHRGSLLEYRRLAEVSGVEIGNAARRVLKSRGIAAFRSIDDIPPSARFDIIRMNWSLEHVHSPAHYFRFIAEHLAAQGKAVIAVPNYDGLLYRAAPDCVEVPIHLYHFRPRDILNYAQKSGLAVIESTTFSYPEMYAVAAGVCPSLQGAFAGRLGVIEARQMQKTLSCFDALGLGNDFLCVLEKAA
ncbi:MAG: class I SAM-dependent methyltransferase [Betaproteobacteria bacterium]|nr:class I SAM-dependent methyltransferase [Betaproteobacteria bacterium]